VEVTTDIAPDGTTWDEIDTHGTLTAHPEENETFKQILLYYVSNVDTLDNSAERHARAIQASQELETRLLGDFNC